MNPLKIKVIFLSCVLSAGPVFAGDFAVVQKGNEPAYSSVDLKPGDKLVFRNHDEFPHYLYSAAPGPQFESHLQQPGATLTVSVEQEGEFDVLCSIHPSEKMHVTVHK
jgi:plastocyanin